MERMVGEGDIFREQIIWFKNERTLKSVHALEHFHVLLYQVPTKMIERLTKGDKSMSTIRAEAEAEAEAGADKDLRLMEEGTRLP